MVKYHRQKSFLFSIIYLVLISGLSFSACRSSNPQQILSSTTLEPTASKGSTKTVPIKPPNSNSSPFTNTQVPVLNTQDPQEPEPSSTDQMISTLAPTETPIPTMVVTSEPPQYPMMGIEIAGYNDTEQVAQAGAYWVRRNALLWSTVEPAEGARKWGAVASLERELEAISAHGMQTILIVRGTPSWAQKYLGVHCGPVLAEKLEAFAAFIRDAVARYSQPPYNVKYWELGNEPDIDPALVGGGSQFGCWGDSNDAYYGGGYYAEMLKVVYPAIKSADPEAQVLVGGLLLYCDPENPPDVKGQPGVKMDCRPAKFLEGVLKNGGGDYFDGVSFHAYDYYFDVLGKSGNRGWYSSWNTSGPVLIAKATYLYNLLSKYGYPDKYLMNTEVAILCGVTGNERSCTQNDWENTKTYYLVEAYTAAATLGLRANIWYSLGGWRSSGLIFASGRPVPAYNALAFNNQMLKGVTPWGEVSLFQGVKGFAFQQDGKLMWVLWSLDGQEHPINLDSLPSAIYTVLGESLIPDNNIIITLSPIYIEW